MLAMAGVGHAGAVTYKVVKHKYFPTPCKPCLASNTTSQTSDGIQTLKTFVIPEEKK